MAVDAQALLAEPARTHEAPQPRRFAIAWRNATKPQISAIGLLEHRDGRYSFRYVHTARDVDGFRPLLGFPDLDMVYESDELFAFFAQRAMDAERPDFPAYVQAMDLPLSASELDVLGRSGGRRKGDKVQLIEAPRVEANGQTSCTFLVSGVRYAATDSDSVSLAIDALHRGDDLVIAAEPDNPANPDAMRIGTSGGVSVGWVPDLLLPYAATVMQSGKFSLRVARANTAEMPWHLRLVTTLSGNVPLGYEPFTGPEWA